MTSTENPFNPGYGVDPPYLAGRQAVFHEILLGLQRGPGRSEYHRLIVGGRGTGKTVLLHRLADYAGDEWRWSAIHWQGRPDWPLHQVVDDEQPRIEHELTGRTRRAAKALRPDSISAGVAGVGTATKRLDRRPGARSVTAQLRHLGQLARGCDRALLLVIDELQAAAPADLAALSGSLQLLANGEHLPIAMIAAGLSNTKAVIRNVPGTTFIERQDEIRIGNLTHTDTVDAIEQPILNAGRSITAAALEYLAEHTGGYPYAIQLAGKHTWDAAGDHNPMTIAHARTGMEQTTRTLATNLYQTRWEDLAEHERRYLHATALLTTADNETSTRQIADHLKLEPRLLSPLAPGSSTPVTSCAPAATATSRSTSPASPRGSSTTTPRRQRDLLTHTCTPRPSARFGSRPGGIDG